MAAPGAAPSGREYTRRLRALRLIAASGLLVIAWITSIGAAKVYRGLDRDFTSWIPFALIATACVVLATHVGGEPLTHGHGAPCRLVVPGHRGFQWVKWVSRVEVTADADLGAAASTVWSSLTPEGRGAR